MPSQRSCAVRVRRPRRESTRLGKSASGSRCRWQGWSARSLAVDDALDWAIHDALHNLLDVTVREPTAHIHALPLLRDASVLAHDHINRPLHCDDSLHDLLEWRRAVDDALHRRLNDALSESMRQLASPAEPYRSIRFILCRQSVGKPQQHIVDVLVGWPHTTAAAPAVGGLHIEGD